MESLERYEVVATRNPSRLYVRAHSRKEALEKLVEYVKNERNYSEEEIKRFVAESFIEKVDC